MKNEDLILIEKLNKIGISLSEEKNIYKVYDLILNTAMQYTNADGGTLYKIENKTLEFAVVKNNTLNLNLCGKKEIFWPALKLFNDNEKPIISSMPTYVFHKKRLLKIDDVYKQTNFDPTKTKEIDKINNYRTKSSIVFPLLNYEGEMIGIIQLINAKNSEKNTISFTQKHLLLFESLGSQISILLSNKNLIVQLEKMIFSLMQAVANTIDKKSEWTGHHIRNVAIITELFAQEINNTNSGYFKDKNFTENEMKEIKLAALIHDIGKIATPQHILDKQYKLDYENIRIDLIKARFDLIINIIKKEIEILKLKKKNFSSQQINIVYLEEDYQLIEDVNNQKVIVDKPIRENLERILSFRKKIFGKMYFLITQKEYENLCIRRGTLNDKEREIIKYHAQITKEILEKVPFPKKFHKLPFYAYTHHEQLNGKGYPSHLTKKDLPLQSRIIAFADIFEALTAYDRIYRKPISIQKSLEILANITSENGLDKNIMDLILDSEVYLKYGEKYLLKKQITTINKSKIRKIYENSI